MMNETMNRQYLVCNSHEHIVAFVCVKVPNDSKKCGTHTLICDDFCLLLFALHWIMYPTGNARNIIISPKSSDFFFLNRGKYTKKKQFFLLY